jgi:hypothetical protein
MHNLDNLDNFATIAIQVVAEAGRAARIHDPMHSPHEAYGVIKEEFEEFWAEVKAFNLPKGKDTRPNMRLELIQTAAMCIRAIRDLNL